ncbi:hypothetical protein E2C01_084352 [Portunus trituberculatus]|uniref:Uncharacterized protein n=1 Tax=Portunus trituberculatus TaxID=210409 RepID=A0A5B7J907_PORTR|nr:hypothetical protein [Portunus trituberculatus]
MQGVVASEEPHLSHCAIDTDGYNKIFCWGVSGGCVDNASHLHYARQPLPPPPRLHHHASLHLSHAFCSLPKDSDSGGAGTLVTSDGDGDGDVVVVTIR